MQDNRPGCSRERSRNSRKRKTVSPIKAGQDYSITLRKQEASASPALKRGRNNCSRDGSSSSGSSDEEVTFVVNKKGSRMPYSNSDDLNGS